MIPNPLLVIVLSGGVWRFWMCFIRCNKAGDGCEVSLRSFPNLRVMFLQETKGREPGAAGEQLLQPAAGSAPGLGTWIGKEQVLPFGGRGGRFPTPPGGVPKRRGSIYTPIPSCLRKRAGRVELV